MVSEDNLNWILRSLDAGGTVPGWKLRVVKETYYLTNEDEGVTWVRTAGRSAWSQAPLKER